MKSPAERARAERRAQGLPPAVADDDALRKAARLLLRMQP